MAKSPRITGAEAVRAFERAGFHLDRTRGSHHILKKAGHPLLLSVPVHRGETLGVGLLIALVEAAGLTPDEFAALL